MDDVKIELGKVNEVVLSIVILYLVRCGAGPATRRERFEGEG
jgi:hypothetical protein